MTSETTQAGTDAKGIHPDATVHPTAHVDATATIGPGTTVGRNCVIGPGVSLGADNRLRDFVVIERLTTVGDGNDFHPFCVIGGDPQDRAFNEETPGSLRIGNRNMFREHVTLHRSTEPDPETLIGDDNFFMAGSHAGHNVRMGNRNTIANGTVFGGHAHIGNNNVFSSYCAIHQFVTIGDGSMFQHASGASAHTPSFVIITDINRVAGLNAVGLRRNPNLTDEERTAIKAAFRAVYRDRGARPLLDLCRERIEAGQPPAAERFYRFFIDAVEHDDKRRAARGLVRPAHARL